MDEKTLKKLLGNKIKQYRKKYDLTQDMLGEKLCRNQRQISLIENGSCFPSPEVLVKMAEIFHCSLQDLFDFDPIENTENIKLKLFDIVNNLPNDKLKAFYIIGKNL